MKKVISGAAALAAAIILPTSAPAAADASACTHHFSGPQVCIRLEGSGAWNSVTAIWNNPPSNVKRRQVHMYIDGRLDETETAKRVGDTLSYTWSTFQTDTSTKICVRFKGSQRTACETTSR